MPNTYIPKFNFWSNGELHIIQGQNWLNLLLFFAENVLKFVKYFWVKSRVSRNSESSILSSDTWYNKLTSSWMKWFPDKSNVFKLVIEWQNCTGKYEILLWAKSRCSRMDPSACKSKQSKYRVIHLKVEKSWNR